MKAIVFVHGFLGFVRIAMLGMEVRYFRGVSKRLRELPVDLYFPKLPATGSIEVRSQALGAFLQKLPHDAIHLIAHSMGGLDSRHCIRHHDREGRIRSLTTIATPHRGTSLARYLLQKPSAFSMLVRWYGSPGLADLTPEACEEFNNATPNRQDVVYESWAGVRPLAEFPFWSRSMAEVITQAEGENDTQVPLSSARWGNFRGCLRADHLELIGWNFTFPDTKNERPFDHFSFYRKCVEKILNSS